MLWMTRSHVKVDRVACPWLIKRFIDSKAEFIFVPKAGIKEAAKREKAIPFDAPDLELGHHGDDCTFDTLIKKYNLSDKALLRLAKIVNAADTKNIHKDRIASGLKAIAIGFSIRFPDDNNNLEKQFEVYDSLYAWCRLEEEEL